MEGEMKKPRTWRARGLRLLAMIALVYAVAIGGLVLFEDKMVYQPSRFEDHWAGPPRNVPVQDVEIDGKEGESLHAWWAAPPVWKPAEGAMLFCHGNGGNLSHRGHALKPWLDQRIGVLLFDYPGFGKSTGKVSEAGCIAAGEVFYEWLVKVKQIPADRVILYGGSLGSGVAVEMATHHNHRALVLISAYTSMPDMAQKLFPWVPAKWLSKNQFRNLDKIGQVARPVFIAHGTTDSLIPFSHGEQLFAAAPEPKAFVPMPNYRHKDFPDPPTYPDLWKFLKERCP